MDGRIGLFNHQVLMYASPRTQSPHGAAYLGGKDQNDSLA